MFIRISSHQPTQEAMFQRAVAEAPLEIAAITPGGSTWFHREGDRATL